jgi:Spy/CpxP family protein refolding chaperone
MLIIAAAAVESAQAQRGGGGFGIGGDPLSLAQQESVQKELALTSEQIGKLSDLAAKRRESFQSQQGGGREARQARFEEMRKQNDVAIAEVLNADQAKRLKQIALQQQGPLALAHDDVAASVGLSDDQKQQVDDIRADAMQEMRSVGQGGGGDRRQMRERFTSIRKAAEDKIKAVLTAEQQAKWTELQGAPFTGEIRRPEFGRGEGGAGRPRQPRN